MTERQNRGRPRTRAVPLTPVHSRIHTDGNCGRSRPVAAPPTPSTLAKRPKYRRPTDQTEAQPTSAMDASKSNNDCPKVTTNAPGEAELQKNNMATGQARQQGKRSGQQSSMQRIEASQGILVG